MEEIQLQWTFNKTFWYLYEKNLLCKTKLFFARPQPSGWRFISLYCWLALFYSSDPLHMRIWSRVTSHYSILKKKFLFCFSISRTKYSVLSWYFCPLDWTIKINWKFVHLRSAVTGALHGVWESESGDLKWQTTGCSQNQDRSWRVEIQLGLQFPKNFDKSPEKW